MKSRNLYLKIAGLAFSVALAVTLIWWNAKARKERMPWLYPENHASIMAEARANGWAVAADDKDGSRYYFMASSKYGWVIRPEDLSESDYRILWRYNQQTSEEDRGRGTTHIPSHGELQTYQTLKGESLELELTIDEVEPGTTVEEILKREAK